MRKSSIITLLFIVFIFQIQAQKNRAEGLIIKDFGATFPVENPDIKIEANQEFKVIFDVSQSSEDKSVVNKYIVTAARFLNMHAGAGMKPEQLKVAMTIHGSAWQDVMDNENYKNKYGVDNPNLTLINQLTAAGADIIICGQTAGFRGLNKDNVNPNVKFVLSAMTALLQYQNNGYQYIKF